jgi:hypothetical protein
MALSNSIHALSPSLSGALGAGELVSVAANKSSRLTLTWGVGAADSERAEVEGGFGEADAFESVVSRLQPGATANARSKHKWSILFMIRNSFS